MRNRNVQFHQIELSETAVRGSSVSKTVICSFDTRRFGYFQIGYDGTQFHDYKNEPDLNMFSEIDKKYIRCTTAIAWRMTFDTVAQTERFE